MKDYATNKTTNKKCIKCKIEFPESVEYFSKRENGLRGSCKECERKTKKEYYQKNKGKYIEKSKKQVISERRKRSSKRKQNEIEITAIGNWKEIKDYDNYLISDEGRVFSRATGKLKKCNVREDGYVVSGLWKNNKGNNVYIHRLVMETFKPENRKETVNHIDGVKTNNFINNLEWSTYSENNHHAIETGLNTNEMKQNNKNSIAILQCDLNGNVLREYPSMRQAQRDTGVDATSIGIGIRKGWNYGGFIWKLK